MSVYIKDMEMPKSCYQCGFLFHPERHGKVYCTAVEPMMDISETLSDERASDCPLVPVPKHGRCVDESALLKGCGYIIADGMACIPVKHIANAPTILEAEEGET